MIDYFDRYLLALEHLRLRWERRGEFLSDDDVFNAADLFTTEQPDAEGGFAEGGDRYRLLDHLYETVFPVDAE